MPNKKSSKPKPLTKNKSKTAKTGLVASIKNKIFKPDRQTEPVGPNPVNFFKLFKKDIQLIRLEWQKLGIIIIIFTALELLFVKGFSVTSNSGQLKSSISHLFHGSSASLATNTSVFGTLLNSSANSNTTTGSIYQTIFVLIFSLVIIWAFRQTIAGKRVRISDAFYKSLGPLIPFILIFVLISIELIPGLLGAVILNTVLSNGLAINFFEKIGWIVFCMGLILISMYWLISAIFALYIVTLPNMRPVQAVRSANKIVKFRRWSLIRKLILLPIVLLIIGAIITVPIISASAAAGSWTVFILIGFALVFVHGFMYTLYRELL
jgi:hypothetical protein